MLSPDFDGFGHQDHQKSGFLEYGEIYFIILMDMDFSISY